MDNSNSNSVGRWARTTSSKPPPISSTGCLSLSPSFQLSGVTNIVDPYATNYSRRFYRAVQFNNSLIAPRLSIPTRLDNGQIEFQVTGLVGSSQVIQASTNLTVWIPIATNVIPGSGTLLVTDPDATNYSRRFYRTMQRP